MSGASVALHIKDDENCAATMLKIARMGATS
jgi:hypothetical protein